MFTAPKQIVYPSECPRDNDGYTLFFHADFFNNYPLRNTISKYGFFSYTVCEALNLSEEEKRIIIAVFETLAIEAASPVDVYSQDVMVSQIELLLNYSNRFYNRQFLTNKNKHTDLLGKVEVYLEQFFVTELTPTNGIPTVKFIAHNLGVSTRYLNDTLRSITGYNTQHHIHAKLIEKAKLNLATNNLTIAEIAYMLGFKHPQSFNKLFKQKTKQSPVEYRRSFDKGETAFSCI